MAIDDTDAFLERRRMRRQVTRWRIVAALVALLVIAAAAWRADIRGLAGGPYVARLNISGTIVDDPARDRALSALARDDRMSALIVRIDSPGGTVAGSEVLYRQLRVIAARRPVVAVMAQTAASGGYMTALAADHIIAREGTITGSIGVLGGKMVTTAMWEKVGLTFDQVDAGANANMWNASRSFSPAEWDRFNAWLDRIYEDFTSKVADGRKLPKEKVLEIAKGRVWTGEDAKAIGLVDELGGYAVALKLAKAAAKIPESEKVKVAVFPSEKNPFETLAARLSGEEEDESSFTAIVRLLAPIRPALRQIDADRQGVLTAPPLTIR